MKLTAGPKRTTITAWIVLLSYTRVFGAVALTKVIIAHAANNPRVAPDMRTLTEKALHE